MLMAEQLRHRFADERRASGHRDARGLQSSNLVCCGALAAGDDGAGMPHAASGRSRPAADETRHRLSYPFLDELCRIFLGAAADFPDEDHGVCFRIVVHKAERIDEAGADDGVAADADARGLTDA